MIADIPTIVEALKDTPHYLEGSRVSYSLCGEDLAALMLLSQEREKGVYVDIGSFHPTMYSNTFLLYLNGWHGLAVDANGEMVEKYKAWRPRDACIRALVSTKVEKRNYYYMQNGAYNGLHNVDPAVHNLTAPADQKILRVEEMTAVPINDILEAFVGKQKFDFLSTDCEGFDTELLLAMDFKRFRPKVISAEVTYQECLSGPLKDHLERQNYKFWGLLGHSVMLLRKD